MKKRVFYTELAYVFGLLTLAFGTALMEKADFGLSMVVAPAYILHLKISQHLPFFTFGMAEYCLQAVLILFMMLLIRKAKLAYLVSFATAVIYSLMLDGMIGLLSLAAGDELWLRLVFYVFGMLICSAGVSLMFHTYISPAAYEMFVKEVAAHFGWGIHRFKTVYDCISCVVAVALSFGFFGLWHFEGIHIGTVVCALLNGTIIHGFTRFFEKYWIFADRLTLKKVF